MRVRSTSQAFGPAGRRRAIEVMAFHGRPVRSRTSNGQVVLTVDPDKLGRFTSARSKVAEVLARGNGTLRPRRRDQREILTVEGVSIRFGGVQALDALDLSAHTGQIAGVIGPNGAGKTTFFNCLSGLLTPDAGKIVFDGVVCKGSPASRARRGLGRTFQTPRLFKGLSVEENLVFGCRTADAAGRPYIFDPGLRRLPHRERVARIASMVGFRMPLQVPAGSLPFGELRTAELARALCGAPSLLMLDEPASGLDVAQAEELIDLLRTLADLGLAILLIEHDMSLVMDVCHHITVLDFGQVIAEGPPEEVQTNETVIEAYLGRSA